MTTTYTTNLRLAKPDFRSGPWAALINANADLIDFAIVSALVAGGITIWTNATTYLGGKIAADSSTNPVSFWICLENHVSPAVPTTFAQDRAANPGRWNSLTFSINPRGEWANDTFYAYYDIAYDSVLGITGICLVPHTSNASGTIQDDSANWAFIVDLPSQGVTPAANVSYDGTTSGLIATNVQAAIDELDGRVDSAATIVSGALSDITDLQTDLGQAQIDIAGNTSSIGDIENDITAIQALDVTQTNRLDAIDAQIAAIDPTAGLETGTKMLFYQAAAPTGWTKQTTDNDKTIRVVSGTGGSSGGTNNFSTVMAQSSVGSTTLTTSNIPSHHHDTPIDSVGDGSSTTRVAKAQNIAGSPGTISSGNTGSGGSHAHSITMDIKYCDVIVCQKD